MGGEEESCAHENAREEGTDSNILGPGSPFIPFHSLPRFSTEWINTLLIKWWPLWSNSAK